MPPYAGDVKWSAVRTMRELYQAPYALLGAASDLHPDTIKQRASREKWAKPGRAPRAGVRTPAQRGLVDPAMLERLVATNGAADGNAVLLAEVEGVLAEARAGRVEKARVDAVLAMIRMVERSEQFRRPAEAAEEKTRSDDELAGLLARVDARIVELARAYAARLGREDHDGDAG